ncbi:hypothetical protein [Thalassorhabdomicrobium marinisediminis]|uniref:hypothetical protein n=1 Tax=Thalassorhabdomicrobium marinisediminis TaxID=2170577 RepID=UPI00249224EE|nr:hypothetical protein [Thalassorhabdomicrobium marinisediminis]
MNSRRIDGILALLEEERNLLLRGDLQALGDLASQKEALTETLEQVSSADLGRLSRALDRNKSLLAAAQSGVATVLETLRAQKQARRSLSTYDRSGRPATIARTSGGTERRF